MAPDSSQVWWKAEGEARERIACKSKGQEQEEGVPYLFLFYS